MRRLVSLVLLIAGVLMSAPHAARSAAPETSLSDLRGVEELKTWFNANKGHVRLVLLLSPT
jgi:hypothetical protein